MEVDAASLIGVSYGVDYQFHSPYHENSQNTLIRISTSFSLYKFPTPRNFYKSKVKPRESK